MSDTYVFYRHRHHPTYRLVVKENAPLPAETTPDQWIDTGHRLEENVSSETIAEVERNGFKLYKLAASFNEFQPSLAALAD